MKVVLLAGGLGTRLSEETALKPKPMIEIGGKPILWHIMKLYSHFGINDFVICCGYKGYLIKEYFLNYFYHVSDITIDLKDNSVEIHKKQTEPWKVTLVDTGLDTMTGGRLLRVKDYIGNQTFCMTYGDGLSDINIHELLKFHKNKNKLATVSGAAPPGRFGSLTISDDDLVTSFSEKTDMKQSFINAGFFVLEPNVFDYIQGDTTLWEKEPIENLAKDKQLSVFKHQGFWQPMDTLREKNLLEDLWNKNNAPWKIW
jgi:glucose-1-phosphate cytidylyltransferase